MSQSCIKWAGPEQRPSLIFVYCTAYIPSETLDRFFLLADHRCLAGRRYSLCWVRNHETHRYVPRRPELRDQDGVWFVYDDDLTATPASLFRVSVELDEHTARDGNSCLLRDNGWRRPRDYGEVRCDFESVLDKALAVWACKTSMRQIQCEAAMHGGISPKRVCEKIHRDRELPTTLVQPSMPRTWRRREDGRRPCPVFVTAFMPAKIIDQLLDAVNLPWHDPDHRVRVKIVTIDLEKDVEYTLISQSPTSILTDCFQGLSPPALCSFIRQQCSQTDLCTKYFVILDHVTTERLPCMFGANLDSLNHRRLNCMIGDTSVFGSNKSLLVRTSFDSCGNVLDRIAGGEVSLQDYANEAAVGHGGCFRYAISHEASRIFVAPNLEPESINSRDVTIMMKKLDGATAVLEKHDYEPEKSSQEQAHLPTSQENREPPASSQISDLPSPLRKLAQPTLSQWARDGRTSTKSKTGGLEFERAKSVTPEYNFQGLLSHDRALGTSQIPKSRKRRTIFPPLDLVPSSPPEDCKRRRGHLAPDSSPAVFTGALSEQSAQDAAPSSRRAPRLDSMIDGEMTDPEDDNLNYMKLPEVSGSTQMSCA